MNELPSAIEQVKVWEVECHEVVFAESVSREALLLMVLAEVESADPCPYYTIQPDTDRGGWGFYHAIGNEQELIGFVWPHNGMYMGAVIVGNG